MRLKIDLVIFDLLPLLLVALAEIQGSADIKCQSNCEKFGSNLGQKFSHAKTIAYGPGLKSGVTLPARYFFIQAVDEDGNNFTSTPPGELKVKITQLGKPTHVWSQILNRKDGSYVVRFKLFQPVDGFKINVTYNDVPVANSPYVVKGLQYHEQCYCPKPFEQWIDTMGCDSNYSQIDKDLSIFRHVDMHSVLKEAKKRFNIPGAYSFCHYAIVNNRVYKKCYGQYVGFSIFMEETLLTLTRKMKLPDVEFISNLGDWPLENQANPGNIIPIFSWCGSETTKDIVMPTYDLTESSLEMMGRVMLDILSVQGNSPVANWDQKVEQGFWRGRDSRMERLDLVALARSNPDLINASLTNFFFFQDKIEEYGPKASHISFFDFFRYKYQINIDGTVAAYRFPYLLAGDSLVLKQDSDYYEHFYGQLQPMVHYVPFKPDLSDLVEKLEWARKNDAKARKIAQNARQFVNDNLLPENIFCYYAQLLKEFSTRLIRPVVKEEDMEEVPQPAGKSDCVCDQNPTKNRRNDEL